jgi:hypothetical protein
MKFQDLDNLSDRLLQFEELFGLEDSISSKKRNKFTVLEEKIQEISTQLNTFL